MATRSVKQGMVAAAVMALGVSLAASAKDPPPPEIPKCAKRFGTLPDEQLRKIVHDTAAKVYGL